MNTKADPGEILPVPPAAGPNGSDRCRMAEESFGVPRQQQ
jgi:hypothetical protein